MLGIVKRMLVCQDKAGRTTAHVELVFAAASLHKYAEAASFIIVVLLLQRLAGLRTCHSSQAMLKPAFTCICSPAAALSAMPDKQTLHMYSGVIVTARQRRHGRSLLVAVL